MSNLPPPLRLPFTRSLQLSSVVASEISFRSRRRGMTCSLRCIFGPFTIMSPITYPAVQSSLCSPPASSSVRTASVSSVCKAKCSSRLHDVAGAVQTPCAWSHMTPDARFMSSHPSSFDLLSAPELFALLKKKVQRG